MLIGMKRDEWNMRVCGRKVNGKRFLREVLRVIWCVSLSFLLSRPTYHYLHPAHLSSQQTYASHCNNAPPLTTAPYSIPFLSPSRTSHIASSRILPQLPIYMILTNDQKARIKAMIDTPFTPLPNQVTAQPSENDITSQLNSNGNDDSHNKKGGDKMDGMPVKKKVPAANVFWTDHLRML